MKKNRTVVYLLCVIVLAVACARPAAAQLMSQADLAKVQELFDTGNSLLNKGDAQQAIKKYTEAIAVAPSIAALYINRGLAYVSLSKYSEAIADADKALALGQDEPSQKTQSAIAYQIKALAVQSQGDNKAALDLYSKAIELDPSNPKYLNGRGNSYRLLERYNEAVADYTSAIKLDPTLPHAFINRAAVYRQLKNHEAALKDLDDAARLDDTSPALFLNRGNVYLDKGKYDEALQDYGRAIAIKPKSEYFYSRALAYFKQGKFDLSVNEATEAIKLDPANSEAYRARSTAYHRMGKNTPALEDIKKAVALNEKSLSMRYNLAYLLFKAGQHQSAIDEATKIIGLDPKWRAPVVLRAAAYFRFGNLAKAKIDQAKAATLSSTYAPDTESITSFDLDILGFEDKEK